MSQVILNPEDDLPERRQWDRWPKEGEGAHFAFMLYCQQPYNGVARDKPAIIKELGHKSPNTVYEWSKKHRWDDRVVAYDTWMQENTQAANNAKRIKTDEQALRIADAMLIKAAQALSKIDPSDMKPIDVARYVDVAMKYQRLILGQSTENIGVRGEITVEDKTLKEINDWAQKIMIEHGSRLDKSLYEDIEGEIVKEEESEDE